MATIRRLNTLSGQISRCSASAHPRLSRLITFASQRQHQRAGFNRIRASKVISRCSSSIIFTDGKNTNQPFTPLVQEYQHQVSRGKLLFDPLQLHAAKKMMRLQMSLKEYDHAAFLEQLKQVEEYTTEQHNRAQRKDDDPEGKPNTTKPVPSPPSISVPIPRGFYIHGNVGTGKSLLLNKFYRTALTAPAPHKKRRIHFHSFLQDIHQRIHSLNKQLLETHGRSFHVNTTKHRNPILRVAEQIATEITLLCIDEFQVTDVADAMILSQFFGELWRRGVVVVATSNRPPSDLYEGGLNREYFMPFIELLQKYCVVHHLCGDDDQCRDIGSSGQREKDYRRIRSGVDGPGGNANKQCGDYFYLTGEEGNSQQKEEAHVKMDGLFQSFQEQSSLQSPSNAVQQPLMLQVHFQRTMPIKRYHSNIIARFDFDELCTTELGSSDYHAIAKNFQVVMIEDIPRLTLKHPDRARRFITLIDELYEANCCLVCTAVDIPDKLFVGKSADGAFGGDESNNNKSSTAENGVDSAVTSGTMLAVDVAQVQGTAVSELASVKELSFAFGRAASRLLEMCSNTWWKEQGIDMRSIAASRQIL